MFGRRPQRPAGAGAKCGSTLHSRRFRRKLSAHRRRTERAIEQRKQQEPSAKSADMSNPRHRHVRKTERLGSGAENEIRSQPDQKENERATLDKHVAQASGGDRLDLRPADRAERSERRPRLKHESRRGAHEAGIRSRGADEGEKSIGVTAQCAIALAIAVTAMKSKNLAEPKRRAIGGPNATSQIVLSRTWVHEPCRKA